MFGLHHTKYLRNVIDISEIFCYYLLREVINTETKYKIGYLVIKEGMNGWIYEFCYGYESLMRRFKELVNAPHVKKISVNMMDDARTLQEV